MTTHQLPSVPFDRVGDVTAAEAVIVEDDAIWIRHPHGGRILVGHGVYHNIQLWADDLQDVLTAWATLSTPDGFAENLAERTYAAKAMAGARGHGVAGPPHCTCGHQADSHADLDEHILAEADS